MGQAARIFALVGLVVFGLAPVCVSAQGTDELWQITSRVEMPGMPTAMPEQTQTVCLQKGQQQEEGMVPKDQNCRMTDVRRSGNRTTFTIVCEGKDRMTGSGDITSSPDSYRGTMKMQGTMDGQPVNMTQSFSGRRTGTCTYEAPEKRVQQPTPPSREQGMGDAAQEGLADGLKEGLKEGAADTIKRLLRW